MKGLRTVGRDRKIKTDNKYQILDMLSATIREDEKSVLYSLLIQLIILCCCSCQSSDFILYACIDQFRWFLALLFFIVLLLLICFMLRKRIFR